MESILQTPQWPIGLSNFVTWCLMWDPKNRPTSFQAMNHEYFADAIDPLTRPKSSTPRLLGRKQSGYDHRASKEQSDGPTLASRPSWFRKSLIGRESVPVVPQHSNPQLMSPNPSPINHSSTTPVVTESSKFRPNASKRATWSNGPTASLGAPMPILPSIRPISPLSNAVTAQARSTTIAEEQEKARSNDVPTPEKKKIGRQLSLASHGNHYGDLHRGDGEGSISSLMSPTSSQKEGFFSHLRKRARRLSGRNQLPMSPKHDDIEANAGCGPWSSNRSSMVVDPIAANPPPPRNDFTELDKALQNVRYSLDASSQPGQSPQPQLQRQNSTNAAPVNAGPQRSGSLSRRPVPRPGDDGSSGAGPGPISSRTRRALHLSSHPTQRYETPDEEEELLNEALNGMQKAVHGMDKSRKVENDVGRNALAQKDLNRQALHNSISAARMTDPYPTPSPSAKRNGILFTDALMARPATPNSLAWQRSKENSNAMCPTPPYEENEWAASAAASIFAASSSFR